MKTLLLLLLVALLCFTAGCSDSGSTKSGTLSPPTPPPTEELPDVIHGTITMEDGGVMKFELYPKIAPQTALNFAYLAEQGFYDGLNFHRILSGMMLQGGCPDNVGNGGPGYTIFGEFEENGFTNPISHERGVLSMARKDDFNSGGSQFFIVHEDTKGWDGKYAPFGMVVSGLDVIDRLAATPTTGTNGAVEPEDRPVIKSITIDDGFVLP